MKIVSAFPGTGKSFCFQNHKGIADSDSSDFSWLDGKRNPSFPENYMEHIRNLKVDLVFVSSHEEVRKALAKEFDFYLVYPKKELKQEYLDRYINRGSPEAFVHLLDLKWDDWIESCEEQKLCTHITLDKGQYISDICHIFKK